MPRCCYYERDSGKQKQTICTSDGKCPDLKPATTGWTLVGQWGVDTCKDCYDSRACSCTDDESPGKVQWEETTLAALKGAIPQGATLWIGRPAADAKASAATCVAAANLVVCVGGCPKGQKCKPEAGKFIDCKCQ